MLETFPSLLIFLDIATSLKFHEFVARCLSFSTACAGVTSQDRCKKKSAAGIASHCRLTTNYYLPPLIDLHALPGAHATDTVVVVVCSAGDDDREV